MSSVYVMRCVIRTELGRQFQLCRHLSTGNASILNKFSGALYNMKPSSTSLKAAAYGLGGGIVTGCGYAYYKGKVAENNASSFEYIPPPPMLQSFPDVPVSRKITIPGDTSGLKLTLFQYPTCPFCCKVRAFLDYYGISYNVVEVDPVLRQQMKWTQYKKVPVLLVEVDGGFQQVFDSSMIISSLASFLKNRHLDFHNIVESYPMIQYYDDDRKRRTEVSNRYFLMGEDPEQISEDQKQSAKEERKWRMWADNSLVHVLSPNVYRTREEALQAFHWFSEVGEWDRLFPAWERMLIVNVGAYAMWIIGKKLKKRHHLKENVRQSLYDECNEWLKELRSLKTDFHGGSKPDLADLAVYGVLSSIEGCQAFQELLQNTKIGMWYYKVKATVENHEGLVHI